MRSDLNASGLRCIKAWLLQSLTKDPAWAGLEDVFKELVAETDRIRFHVFGILALYMRAVSELNPRDFIDDNIEIGDDDGILFPWSWSFLHSSPSGLKNKRIICFGAVKHAMSLALRGHENLTLYDGYPGSYSAGQKGLPFQARRLMCFAAREYFAGITVAQPPIKYFNSHVGDQLAKEIETVFNNYLSARRDERERSEIVGGLSF